MITREFDLMLYQEGNLLFINANQYDSGEQWIFTLYEENGVKYTPATGAIVGVKSDGKGIINTGTVDEYGRVVINETQQMTAAAGLATFELLIDNDTHGTANFKVDVEPRPADNADLSDSDLSLIQEAVDSAEVIVEVIGDSDPSEVIGEHVDAWLDNHPEATTTVLDGAITAPKINNSLWDKLLVSEEASGAVASFDDGADDVPVSSLKVTLEPIQIGSGDPSPSNIRPIYPANNRNQFPTTADGTYTNSGVTVVANNGVYTVTGTGTANSYIEIPLVASVDLSPSENQLAFMNTVADGNIEFALYRGTTRVHYWAMSPQNRVTNNWPDTGNEVVDTVRFNFQNGKTYNITISPVLCLATYPTPTAFTPYQGIMVEQTGKNLYPVLITDESFSNNGSATHSKSDGVLTINTSSSNANSGVYVSVSNSTISATLRALGDSTRYISFDAEASVPLNVRVTSGAATMISVTSTKQRYIVPSTGVNLSIYGVSTTSVLKISNVMVSYETDATYEPYTSASYPYSLGQSVYGGTVDLATGVLTVTDGYIASYNGETLPSTWISDRDVYASGTTPTTGAQVVYKLATPQTINLTPTQVNTLLGYNNISSSGTVDVIYHADTKLYVDKMTNVDNAIIAPTEETFTATRNYTVNDLLIVADTLYKVTANIATGSAITPNSNVTQTTLSALIKALS